MTELTFGNLVAHINVQPPNQKCFIAGYLDCQRSHTQKLGCPSWIIPRWCIYQL